MTAICYCACARGLNLGLYAKPGIDTGFFARGGNIFIECAETDV